MEQDLSPGIENLEVEPKLIVRKKRGEGPRFGKRFVLTERDLKALKWISEQGVGTVEQLWWAVWKNRESKSSKYAEERLRYMARYGHIKKERVFGSGTTNYLVTQKGRYLVEEAYPDRRDFLPPVPKRVNDGQYRHTMALNWCRVFLEKDDQVIHWMSDRAIQSWLKRKEYDRSSWEWFTEVKHISPDACFEYQGENWLFEYEATQKNKTKYEQKAKVLPRSSSAAIRGVIFVAATSGLKSILQKYFNSYQCVIFTFEELKQGKVNQFLKDLWERVETKRKENERHQAKLRAERAVKEIPILKKKIEVTSSFQEGVQKEILEAQKACEQKIRELKEFENRLLKLPMQRDSLTESLNEVSRRLNELRNQDHQFTKELSEYQFQLRELEQF